MSRKARSRKDREIEFLTEVTTSNTIAIKEGPNKKKKWSTHDLKHIKPLTESQRMMFEAFFQGNHVVATGSAGTGKTFIASYLALSELLEEETPYDKIIIVRSAVQGREIGHLPGSIEEKLAAYEAPYIDIFGTLLRKYDAYQQMKDAGLVEFMPTSFVRGLTWNNAIVVIDEMQNCNFQEIHSVMTRIGENTKIITCGDIAQNDLLNKKNDVSGYTEALRILGNMKSVDIVTFTEADIVRSNFVRDWIVAKQAA